MRRTVGKTWILLAGTGILLTVLGFALAGGPLSVLDQCASIGSFLFGAFSLAQARRSYSRSGGAGAPDDGSGLAELDAEDVAYLVTRPRGDVAITKDVQPPPTIGRSARRSASRARVTVRRAGVVVHDGQGVTISDGPAQKDTGAPPARP
ncbi:hypothetical protein COUCH_34010 [Couchioplanes caeruleus]|uniref:hypothetical protein n=1 Tax=Couchioplanes caeruleus TaxID=56438 RepID=UPI0020BFFDD2|nr:hypothetical protein [Couchioplanes caeruleus]UQU63940.1 hypothetical protein COUCH_34010 [Couchioplanes caeruleus]